MTDSLVVIAIDPGRMTGYCQARIMDGKLHYLTHQQMDEVDDLWRRLQGLEPRYIVCEDFEFRGGHHRAATGIEYFPIQLIGVARLYAEVADHQCACYLQKPAQGKAYYTNPVLKTQGYLKRGMATSVPHGIDAMRHLFQWFTFGPGFQFNEAMHNEPFAFPIDKW
jgi:hypothetical protein